MSRACNYYLRLSDQTVWAVLIIDGKPSRAVGPLNPQQTQAPPFQQNYQDGISAEGWDLRMFRAVGKRCECIAAPPPMSRKRILEVGRGSFRAGLFAPRYSRGN